MDDEIVYTGLKKKDVSYDGLKKKSSPSQQPSILNGVSSAISDAIAPAGKESLPSYLERNLVEAPVKTLQSGLEDIQQIGNTSPETLPADFLRLIGGIGKVALSPFSTLNAPLQGASEAVKSATGGIVDPQQHVENVAKAFGIDAAAAARLITKNPSVIEQVKNLGEQAGGILPFAAIGAGEHAISPEGALVDYTKEATPSVITPQTSSTDVAIQPYARSARGVGEAPAEFIPSPTEPQPGLSQAERPGINVRQNPQAHFRVSQIERDFQAVRRDGKPYDIAQHYTEQTAREIGVDESATQRFQDLTKRVQDYNQSLKSPTQTPPQAKTVGVNENEYDKSPYSVKKVLDDSGIPAEKLRKMDAQQIDKVYKESIQKAVTEAAKQHPQYENIKKITDDANVRLDEIRGKSGEERVGFTDEKTKHTRSLPIEGLTADKIRAEIESVNKPTPKKDIAAQKSPKLDGAAKVQEFIDNVMEKRKANNVDPSTPLNLDNLQPRSPEEVAIDKQLDDARDQVKGLNKQIAGKMQELVEKKVPQDVIDRQMKAMNDNLQIAVKAVQDLEPVRDKLIAHLAANQKSLFDQIEAEREVASHAGATDEQLAAIEKGSDPNAVESGASAPIVKPEEAQPATPQETKPASPPGQILIVRPDYTGLKEKAAGPKQTVEERAQLTDQLKSLTAEKNTVEKQLQFARSKPFAQSAGKEMRTDKKGNQFVDEMTYGRKRGVLSKQLESIKSRIDDVQRQLDRGAQGMLPQGELLPPETRKKGDLFDDENGLKRPSGKLTSGIDPGDFARALGIRPTRAAFNEWIKKFGFKAANLDELANAIGPFGQPFFRKPTPRGEMPAGLKLPWIDPEQPIEGQVKELGTITKKLQEGLSPGITFRQAFEGRINNPINDALEAAQAKYVNMQEMESFTKKTLRGVSSAESDIRKAFEPIIKEYQPLYNQMMKLSEFDGEELHFKKGSEAQARELWDQMKTMLRQRDIQLTELARNHADVRIYLAAEDKVPPAVYVSAQEMTQAKAIQTLLNDVVKKDLDRVGIATREETYMPHIVDKDDFGQVNLFDNNYLPKELQFEHRQFMASSWMPSVRAAMESYIPRVSEKLAYHPFYQKWTPYFEAKEMTPELRHFFETFVKDGIKRRQTGFFDTVLNSFVSLDFLRLMGGSFSAPFKHVFKYVGNASAGQLPITIQATGRTIGGILNMLPRKLGITDRTLVERAAPEFVTSRALLALQDEMPQDQMANIIQRMRKYANTVAPIEWAENAQEVISTLMASSYSNLDPISVRQAVWDRISRFNFRSGPDQPLIMKKTGARAATMFQMTPWKLFEQKIELAHDAILGRKDVFGDPYTMKLARMLFIVGTTEAIARRYGYSILDKYLHIPFTVQGSGPVEATEEDDQKYKLTEPKFQPPPAVQLALDMKDKGIVEGAEQYYTGAGTAQGQPSPFGGGTPEKLIRSTQGDIPDIYEGSYLRYLLSQPTVGAQDAARDRQDYYRILKDLHLPPQRRVK